jgi:hypothetical protein
MENINDKTINVLTSNHVRKLTKTNIKKKKFYQYLLQYLSNCNAFHLIIIKIFAHLSTTKL